jgi:hypothetical protein
MSAFKRMLFGFAGKKYDQMARDELPEEEYQKVRHLLEIRTHKEE